MRCLPGTLEDSPRVVAREVRNVRAGCQGRGGGSWTDDRVLDPAWPCRVRGFVRGVGSRGVGLSARATKDHRAREKHRAPLGRGSKRGDACSWRSARWLGVTSATTGAPRNGSLLQSVLGLLAIVLAAVFGLDPTTYLFFWCSSLGALGVLVLITATSAAVIGFSCAAGAARTCGASVWLRRWRSWRCDDPRDDGDHVR